MPSSAAPGWIARAAWLLALAWPVAVHGAVLLGRPDWAPRATAAAIVLAALLWAFAARRAHAVAGAAVVALLVPALAFATPQALLYAPPVVINAALAVVFGRSLLAPRDPVITVFARMEHAELPAELARYTRRLTLLWTLLFAAMAGIALALALTGPLALWSAFTNVVSYLLVIALFAGELVYRRWRYRRYHHAGLFELARNVRRAGLLRRH